MRSFPHVNIPSFQFSLGTHHFHISLWKCHLLQAYFLSGKASACQCSRYTKCGFDFWVGKIPRRREWKPTTVFLPGKPHGQRSLVGYSPWGRKEAAKSSLNFIAKSNWAHTTYTSLLLVSVAKSVAHYLKKTNKQTNPRAMDNRRFIACSILLIFSPMWVSQTIISSNALIQGSQRWHLAIQVPQHNPRMGWWCGVKSWYCLAFPGTQEWILSLTSLSICALSGLRCAFLFPSATICLAVNIDFLTVRTQGQILPGKMS